MILPILVVEDSADDVDLFRQILETARVRNPLLAVRDAQEARSYLSGQPPFSDRNRFPSPRIIVLDLRLPAQDGFEVLRWVRGQEQFKDILIVVLSVSDDLWAIRRAYELGANSFLAKPVKVADVENLVRGFPQYWTRSTAER